MVNGYVIIKRCTACEANNGKFDNVCHGCGYLLAYEATYEEWIEYNTKLAENRIKLEQKKIQEMKEHGNKAREQNIESGEL